MQIFKRNTRSLIIICLLKYLHGGKINYHLNFLKMKHIKDECVSLFFKILPCEVEQNGPKGSRMDIIVYYFPR